MVRSTRRPSWRPVMARLSVTLKSMCADGLVPRMVITAVGVTTGQLQPRRERSGRVLATITGAQQTLTSQDGDRLRPQLALTVYY